jgi:hypothetical protein
MIDFPDRLSGLIAKLEAGQTVSQRDVNRLATLQALDLAKVGEDFMRATCQADDAQTQRLKADLEAS